MNITFQNEKILDSPVLMTNKNSYKMTLRKVLSDAETDIYSLKGINGDKVLTDTLRITFSGLFNFKEGVAYYRYPPWKAWTKPIKINTIDDLFPDDQQFFLWKNKKNVYVAMLPLSGNGFRSTIGKYNKKLMIEASAGTPALTDTVPFVIVGVGKDPFAMIEKTIKVAMAVMGKTENLREKKVMPEPFQYLGYCTWNAMADKMNEQIILDAIDFFNKNNFPLKTLIIDDGWLDMQPNRKLKSFKPDRSKFPNELKPMIDKLKSAKGLKNVGVWHTLNGYWQGLDPAGELFQRYPLFSYYDQEPWLLERLGKDTFFIADPRTEKGSMFFDDWYKYLSAQGIDFVKADNQLVTERVTAGQIPLFDFAEKWHLSLQSAVSKYFNGAVINCMDMTTDAFYNFGSSAVARTVEDFFPYKAGETYNLQRGNAAAHVLSACYNALWFGYLVYADYDMFQSHHPDAEYHAVCRALSGGPVYITDIPGKQNFDVLRKLVTSDGKILRSDQPLVPTEDCLFQLQETKPFKTFTMSGNIGLLAIFHASDTQDIKGSWSAKDVPVFKQKFPDSKFAAYEHFSGNISETDLNTLHNVSLKRMEVQLLYISPIINGKAPIGLLNKYNGAAAIKSCICHDNGLLEMILSDGGRVGVFCEEEPVVVRVNNKDIKYNFMDSLLVIDLPEGKEYSVSVK